jgi:hypothetical protein
MHALTQKKESPLPEGQTRKAFPREGNDAAGKNDCPSLSLRDEACPTQARLQQEAGVQERKRKREPAWSPRSGRTARSYRRPVVECIHSRAARIKSRPGPSSRQMGAILPHAHSKLSVIRCPSLRSWLLLAGELWLPRPSCHTLTQRVS